MSYADKTLTCRDCGQPFVFTAGEQEFYAQKGFTNEPTRCGDCRKNRKSQMNRGDGGYRSGGSHQTVRESFKTTCDGCGQEAVVPFVPRNNKPVYCETCYPLHRPGGRQ
jgi:CxxC-x17-CxxC domain-containing protein